MQSTSKFILILFAIIVLLILAFWALISLRIDLIIFDLPYLIFTNLQGHIIEGSAIVLMEFAFFCFVFFRRKTLHPAAVSILITTGICFTFYGVSKGLVDFDTNNIQQSLPHLIDGVKTAFLVSVLAIFLAIVLKIIAVLSEIFGKKDAQDLDEFIYIDQENATQKEILSTLKTIQKELEKLNEKQPK